MIQENQKDLAMTKEEKDLVMKDLCSRLPYGVYVQIVDRVGFTHTLVELNPEVIQKMWSYKSIKPYLRPMSSMTEEEREELKELTAADIVTNTGFGYKNLRGMCFGMMYLDCQEIIDWFNKKMFDYRGLIPRGCAIAVTEGNNPYE